VPHHRPRKTRPIEVLHEDDDVIVVNKPPGMWPEHGIEDTPGVLEQLQDMAAGSSLRPVYRLDREISGLMLWAKSDDARRRIETALLEQRLTVTYLAIVRARVDDERGLIDLPLRSSREGCGPVRVDDQSGTAARTEWHLRDAFVGFALLECVPRTMIQSQIRAHLQAAHMPLAVDPAYGGAPNLMLSSFKVGYRRSRRRPERPLIQRPTLHAWSLCLQQSVGAPTLELQAPAPKDMRATLHQLDRFGRLPK